MASYSTDDQFFADVAKFLKLVRQVTQRFPTTDGTAGELMAELLKAAIDMTDNGVFTYRRKHLVLELAALAVEYPDVLETEGLTNFLVEKNARKTTKNQETQ